MSLALAARVKIAVGESAGEITLVARTRDISNDGAYLWCRKRLAVGQLLAVTIDAPADQGREWAVQIQCQAEVVRVDPPSLERPEFGVAMRIRRFHIPKVVTFPETLADCAHLLPGHSRWVN